MNIVAKVGELSHSGSPKTDPNALEYLVDHELLLDHTSKVLLNVSPSQIKRLSKDGHDLLITFQNDDTLRIINFYMESHPDSELYLTDDDGDVLFALITPGSNGELMVEYIPVEQESDDRLAGAWWESDWGLAGLGLLGLGAIGGGIAAALGDDDGSGGAARSPAPTVT
ncbi:MAG: BapA/Bap/LapF family prefix-like domain-containing protein, partial [Gammaproteobacteria bacterium]